MGRLESWVGIRLLFAVMVVTVLCVLSQVSVAQQQYTSSGVGAIVTKAMFDKLWPNRNASFYTYAAFIAAAKSYPKFGTEGTKAQKLREIAAFAAHVQQETAGNLFIHFALNAVCIHADSTSSALNFKWLFCQKRPPLTGGSITWPIVELWKTNNSMKLCGCPLKMDYL